MEERKSKVMFEFAGGPVYQSDLSEEAIARLNEELVEEFKNEFNDERCRIAEAEVLTNQSLKKILEIALERDYEVHVIFSIMFNPNLEEIDEKAWKNLSEHKDWKIRVLAARSRVATNERLQEMLKHEMKKPDSYVVNAILSNPNLREIDEDVWKDLSEHEDWMIRRGTAGSRCATNERLQKMLKHEPKVEQSSFIIMFIIKTILSNPNLREIDEEVWKDLSEHEDWKIRVLAAESRFATRKRLVKMVEHEMENPDSMVMEAIMFNKNFLS